MKVETLLKVLGVVFAVGVSWGGATVAAKQELSQKVSTERFVADSARVVNDYAKAMWEIRGELEFITSLTRDNTLRLREICEKLKAGCR